MNRFATATRFQSTMKSKITQITVILFVMLKVSVSTNSNYQLFILCLLRIVCVGELSLVAVGFLLYCWCFMLQDRKKIVFCYTQYHPIELKAKNIIIALTTAHTRERYVDLNSKLGRFLKLKLTVPLYQKVLHLNTRQNWRCHHVQFSDQIPQHSNTYRSFQPARVCARMYEKRHK